MGRPYWQDWEAEYERLPDRTKATQLPPDCEGQLRALGAAIKATGMPLSGPTMAAAAAGIVLAELWAKGWTITQRETRPVCGNCRTYLDAPGVKPGRGGWCGDCLSEIGG